MSQNETLDYDAMGIRWETEPVSRTFGENQSDKRIVNPSAQILVIEDIDKFRATFGDDFLLATANGTSPRVICQRIGRHDRFHNGRDIEGNRAAVLNAVRGTRNTLKAVTRHPLPDGTFYHGTDETEYRQLYMAGLVDAGVPTGIAQNLAKVMAW